MSHIFYVSPSHLARHLSVSEMPEESYTVCLPLGGVDIKDLATDSEWTLMPAPRQQLASLVSCRVLFPAAQEVEPHGFQDGDEVCEGPGTLHDSEL